MITGEKSINLTFNNCNFYSDSVYGYVLAEKSRIMIYNSNFLSYCRNSAIELDRGQLFVENSTFENCNAQHGSIINFKGDYFKIGNSKFKNSKANSTGGAIIAKYFPLRDEDSGVFFHSGDMIIENCIFFNISSSSNGGVIHIDLDSASRHIHQSLNVSDCNFTDCSSKFGGAISVLGGSLNVNRCLFENNSANFEGGVVYTSWTCVNINESDFLKNNANHNAGALYFDKGNLTIKKSNFINNRALNESTNTANAIFAYDVAAYIANSTFDNGGVAVFADFAADSKIENVEKKQ